MAFGWLNHLAAAWIVLTAICSVQLVDRELLVADLAFYQIADRNDANYCVLTDDRQMT